MTVALPQAAADELLDTSIDQLVFDVRTRGKHGLSTGVGDVLQDGMITQTMKGATNLSLDFFDREYRALQSGLFGTRVEVAIDNVPFRLTKVSLVSDELLRALFEHRLIAEMREHTKMLHARRGTVTRAEFVLKMLKELKGVYSFICPELHRHQPIAAKSKAEIEEEAQASQGDTLAALLNESAPLIQVGRGPGIKAEPHRIASRGAEDQFTQAQLDNASILLSVGIGLNAPMVCLEAVICAGFGESDLGQDASTYTPNSAGYYGVLQWGSGQNGSVPSGIDPHDAAQGAYYFFKGGKGFQGGGAIAYAHAHPGVDPGTIATEVEKSGEPGSYYGKHAPAAKNIISKYHGGGASFAGGGVSAPSATVKTAAYEFTRGKVGQVEDTFTCALRLAEEVLWRFFVVGRKSGRQSIYFVQDDDLLKAHPRYIIDPVTVGVRSLTYDVEVGKRTVVVKGRRQPKPSEATLVARMERWDAPPGTVIELADYGPADGKWLVDTVERSPYDPEGTVHLRAPERPLPEARKNEAGEREASGEPSTTASASVAAKLAQQHPELKQPVRDVVAIILTKYPALTITSTTSGNHASNSLHYQGRAADLAGANMDAIGLWISRELTGKLTEGIHNPTLSVKDGKSVPSSFWGSAVWAGHVDHLHIGV